MPDTPLAPQFLISVACEEDLHAHGDSFRGVGYTKSQAEADARYALMLGLVRESREPVSVLDFGCGLAHLLDYINCHPAYQHINYSGLDISSEYLANARTRHPQNEFILMDVLDSNAGLADYDYVLLNGVFNYRGSIPYERMLRYWEALITVMYRHCRHGIAFNVMSKIVDWERDDLFHLPFETMTRFIGEHISRYFVVRHDYRAFEYTTYVYRVPTSL
jgi:SAM-dependent methyltransferase